MQSAAVIPDNFNSTVYEALESADNVILFQWDLTDDTFRLRDTTRRHRYALPSFFSRASTQLAIGGLIHPDDAGISFVEECEKENIGTKITLHIKEDSEEERYSQYLESYTIQEIIKSRPNEEQGNCKVGI